MKTAWVEDIATFEPPTFQPNGKNGYVQRKDITPVEVEDPETGEIKTEWHSMLRFISQDVYESMEDTSLAVDPIKDDTSSIITNQEGGAEDQYAIMEAITDLYSLIEELREEVRNG